MSSSTKRNLIIALLLISVSGLLYVGMLYQIYAQGILLEEQLDTLQVQQAQEASRLALVRTVESSQQERDQLRSHFLSRDSDSIDFLNQVEQLAPQVAVALETKGLEVIDQPADSTKWIQADFELLGTHDQVIQFIQLLETMMYVSRLTKVELSILSSTQWAAAITMQVRISSYGSE